MKKLVVDFETMYDSKAGYTLRKMSMVEYVRDARFKVFGVGVAYLGEKPRWISAADIPAWVKSVNWADTALIGHNVRFDGSIIAWHYGVKPALWIDTMGMSRGVLGATVPSHSLDALATHYGFPSKGIMLTDGKATLTAEEEAALAEYCKHDVELCGAIYEKLDPVFPAGQYGALDWTIRAYVEPILVINSKLAEETAEFEKAKREKIIADIGIEKAIFSSNDKFAKLLEEKGYEVPMKFSPKQKNEDGTKKEIPALALGDPEFLDMMDTEDDVLRALCEARVAVKSTILPTRAAKFALVGKTGPWPFDVQFSGAKQTHRYSGGKGAGGNPQNLPRGSALRKCIEPPAGFKLVVGDFSNIELRVVAYLSGDANLIRSIEAGRDLYCDFGTAYYGRTITKADEKERRFGKTAVLGLGYNMGGKKFARTVFLQLHEKIDSDAAKKAVYLFREMYPGIPAMWEYLDGVLYKMAAGEKGFLPNLPAVRFEGSKFILPSGLPIQFPELRQVREEKNGELTGRLQWVYTAYKDRSKTPQAIPIYGGKVLENLSQALAGEICKVSIERVKANSATPIQVHDEVGQVVYNGWEQDAAVAMEKAMSTAPDWWPQIKLKAEVGVGPNWGDAKH